MTGELEVPTVWRQVQSPLVSGEWDHQLRGHPDTVYTRYLVRGMQEGFRIGFRYSECRCKSAKANMKSAGENPGVIEEYLAREVRLGRVIGPLEPGEYPGTQLNRFGVIPKGHQTGKWRLIVTLLHPKGESVNDGIEPELCTLRYTSVDEAVQMILGKGPGALLAKFDVESAYRVVPVHPADRWLLGMQ